MNNKELTWLSPFVDRWQAGIERGRVPHAVLLLGSAGLGKRCAASWLAKTFLGLPCGDLPVFPEQRPEHADLQWISPLEDKHVIGIDAIRELSAGLALTSYEGTGKVAVIDPANAMTGNAGNSLLKTLEEPSGNTLLILIADRVARIPATVFSRCQRIRFSAPQRDVSLAWLDSLKPGVDWARPLSDAANAPLAALEAAERAAQTEAMGKAFAELPERRRSPLEVAAEWAKLDPALLLDWMAVQVQNCIARSFQGMSQGSPCLVRDTVLRGIDRRNLFCYLDNINRLRSQPVGSFNVLLTLESLLIDWADRLQNYRQQGNLR